jgi:hypothetical protein
VSQRALLGALAILALMHAAILAYHLGLTLAFPYDLDYGEGYVLNDAVRLSRGESLYVDLQQFPMVRSPYPPLFPLLWSLVVPLSGPVLAAGRLMSILSLASIAALVAWNAWRVRCGAWPIVAAVGLVAASPFVYQWSGYARVDLLALAFAIGGVVAAQWLPARPGVVVAAVLCTLALWTKQTTLTAAVAVALALALRNPRHGFAFATLIVTPTAVAGFALNTATSGEFARHVLLGNSSNPISPVRGAIYVGTFAALYLPGLVAGVWWLRRALTRAPSPIATYLPVTLLAAFSAGNGGSSVNYLIEPVLALALVAPFAWRAVPSASALAAPLFAVVQLGVLTHVPNGFGTQYLAEHALGHTPTAEDAAVGARLDEIISTEPGEVVAEAAGFAVRNGRAVYVQPIDLRAEQLQGRWRSAPLVEALSSGRFSQVVTAYNFFPADAERAIDEHFSVTDTLSSPNGLVFQVHRYTR